MILEDLKFSREIYYYHRELLKILASYITKINEAISAILKHLSHIYVCRFESNIVLGDKSSHFEILLFHDSFDLVYVWYGRYQLHILSSVKFFISKFPIILGWDWDWVSFHILSPNHIVCTVCRYLIASEGILVI